MTELSLPPNLKLDKKFQPCPLDEGDEAYPNGIFVFNIIRLLATIDAHPESGRQINMMTICDREAHS
jgi:hypothetical protein